MAAAPVPLARPVLVLAGYRAWSVMPRTVASWLRCMTGARPDRFASLAYPWSTDFPAIVARAAALAESRWSGEEIDVVGVSMGGLVARAAAAGIGLPHSLRIRRLFTLGTPHQGAKLAALIAPDAAARDMRPGSAFLARLDAALPDAGYELICYTRLHDSFVGASRTFPRSTSPHWVSGTWILSHLTISSDPRILIDIARRLRGEPPIAQIPAAPPRD